MGKGSFVNGCAYLMRCASITLGPHVFVGPYRGTCTVAHPLLLAERDTALGRAEPVTIGDDCLLGGNATICHGVTVGAGAVIGAGSAVTPNIPSDVVVAGNPCGILRERTNSDRML